MTKIMTKSILFLIILCGLLLSPQFSLYAAENNYSSVEERRIEKTILEERAKIRKEREEIDLRKKELKSLEEGVDKKLAEIDNKLSSLQTLQKKIEILLEEKSAKEQKQIDSLAKIYEKMSPAKAALAISGLEQQLASDLLGKMKTKAAAKILDQVSKQKTTEISTTYTTLQLE
ncbi:MAG: flagellar motility protein MotE (MotC chaperone) [Desulforhopalus sp.]|jgi:flagellar motility protein MotE (MotC chaperone)